MEAAPGIALARFEDLVAQLKQLDSAAAQDWFADLFAACGIAMPDDWRERVRIGSDRRESATARENLTGIAIELPAALPARHRALVDYQAPGLRALLGYA